MAQIENYAGNSHKQKEASLVRPKNSMESNDIPEKKNEKLIKGEVKRRKSSTKKKILDTIIGEDIPDVKDHIIWEVIIPSIGDTIKNLLISVVESTFNGSPSKHHSNGSYISYNSISSSSTRATDRTRSMYDYDEIIFDNRGEAEEVLQQLRYSIKRYGYVSILDYYDMVGVRTRPSDANYGWINLNAANVERVNGGYLLRLPKAMPID